MSSRYGFFREIIFTARNSSYGKVMFSQVCVNNSVHGGGVRGIHTPPGTHAPPGMPPSWTCMSQGTHAPWAFMPPHRDALNERAVRILLECILVWW